MAPTRPLGTSRTPPEHASRCLPLAPNPPCIHPCVPVCAGMHMRDYDLHLNLKSCRSSAPAVSWQNRYNGGKLQHAICGQETVHRVLHVSVTTKKCEKAPYLDQRQGSPGGCQRGPGNRRGHGPSHIGDWFPCAAWNPANAHRSGHAAAELARLAQ